MKIIIGPTANEAKFLDDKGEPLELAVCAVRLDLKPGEPTVVTLDVRVDEIIVEPDDENIKITEIPR